MTFFYRKWAILADLGPFWAQTTRLRTARKNEPLGVRRWVSPFWNQIKQDFLLTKGGIELLRCASLVENTPMLQGASSAALNQVPVTSHPDKIKRWDLQILKISSFYFSVNKHRHSQHQPYWNQTHLLLKGQKGQITDIINDCVHNYLTKKQ